MRPNTAHSNLIRIHHNPAATKAIDLDRVTQLKMCLSAISSLNNIQELQVIDLYLIFGWFIQRNDELSISQQHREIEYREFDSNPRMIESYQISLNAI